MASVKRSALSNICPLCPSGGEVDTTLIHTIVREFRGILQISKTFLVLIIHVFTKLSTDQEDFPYSINLVWYFQIHLIINLSLFSPSLICPVLVAANAIKPSQEKHLKFQKSISSISNSHRFIYLSCWCC